MAHFRFQSDSNDDPRTLRSMRSGSMSSDVLSSSGHSYAASIPAAQPPPAYIATVGASQLISTEIRESVVVSQAALALVNGFLDQLLFDLLRTSNSTALPQLKNAVPVALKPRLGRAALKAADDELREYLEDSDDEDANDHPPWSPRADFDLDLAWKLARLRCMVYTRLGDLEEEDEEEILEGEGLREAQSRARHATQLGPASAIFLTSVLEFIGEQALYYAAQHAQRRSQAAKRQEEVHGNQSPQTPSQAQLTIEDTDMAQIGRESPLSRLWRSWKRATKASRESVSRPISPEMVMTPRAAGDDSANVTSPLPTGEPGPEENNAESMAKSPSQVPLPMSERDVDEIEVPGLAPEIQDGDDRDAAETPALSTESAKRRPTSMLVTSLHNHVPLTPTSTNGAADFPENSGPRPPFRHTRSSSLPTPVQTPFATSKQLHDQALDDVRRHEGSELDPSDSSAKEASAVAAPAELGELPEDGAEQGDEDRHSEDESVTHPHPAPAAPKYDDDEQQVGRVAAAVSAVAGVFGLGAVSTYLKPEPQPEDQTNGRDHGPARTVAEEMLGLSSGVRPPHDAVTAASITSVGDFNSIQMPSKRTATTDIDRPIRAVSDPEDLALSSEDEREPTARQGAKVETVVNTNANEFEADGNRNAATFYNGRDAETEGEEPEALTRSSESSPSSRQRPANYATKAIHRQAIVYEDANQLPRAPQKLDYATPGIRATGAQLASGIGIAAASSYHTQETAAAAATVDTPQNLTSRQQDPNTLSTSTTSSQPGDSRTQSYLTPSSGRPGSSHAATNSKSSQYTQHSKSSSSSSKLLGFDREQQASLTRGPSNEVFSDGEAVASKLSKSKRPSHLRLRTDDDEVMDTETKKKSLEMLINSDETLHYTLTPSSARAEHFTIPPKPKSQAQELADFFRNTKPPSDDAPRPRTAKSLVSSNLGGLRSNPVSDDSAAQQRKYIPSSKDIAPLPMSPKFKSRLGGPREARIEKDSTRDLADYARSTGPENPSQLPKSLGSGVSQSAPGSSAGPSSARTSSSRAKYQAREAAVSRQAESSDLIDFIREGPPRPPGEHRIDRKVAPFRRTMDSEDLNGLAPAQENDHNGASSVASTQNSSMAKSMQSSLNSRTALLDSSTRSNGSIGIAKNSPGPTLRQSALAEEGFTPKRTRRRVPDPYAIEDSDEDREEEVVPTPKSKTNEESLIDFLRNTAPPPNMTTRPIMTSGSSTTSSSTVRPQSSNPGLRERLLQNAALNGLNRKLSNATRPTREGDQPPAYNRSANGARTESPHLTQVGSKLDNYRPTKPTHANHLERNRQKPRVEAREPRTGGNTSDLADYLRSSGPPGPPVTSAPKGETESVKEEAGFLKFFTRRRSVKS